MLKFTRAIHRVFPAASGAAKTIQTNEYAKVRAIDRGVKVARFETNQVKTYAIGQNAKASIAYQTESPTYNAGGPKCHVLGVVMESNTT